MLITNKSPNMVEFYKLSCGVVFRDKHSNICMTIEDDGNSNMIYLVDGSRADDQLQLTVRFEHALDALDVFERFLIELAVVCDNQTESGRAVCRADDV